MAEAFDVTAYGQEPVGSLRARLGGVGEPLSPEVIGALHYVRRRLQDTSTWLSKVLVTPTHKEARITAFLATWAYEQHWLGDALGALAGESAALPTPPGFGNRLVARLRQFGPLWAAITANVHGRALIGAQMTERLVDNWLLNSLLARLQLGAPAAVAADLALVRRALGRQAQFFQEVATAELAASARTRRLTRHRLLSRTFPLGAEREPHAATKHALRTAFGADRQWAKGLNARVGELPGLAGLEVLHAL